MGIAQLLKNKNVKALVFIFLITISSCNQTKNTQSEFDLPESDFVILPFNKDWYWIFKNVKSTELTRYELIEIEKILNIAVKENNERQRKYLQKHN